MGLAKTEMMDAEERGWYEPEGHVCADCVEDEYLKDVIRANVVQRQCDYCGRQTEDYSAAPVGVLMEPIAHAIFHYFDDPTQAGVAYDKEWMAPLVGTHEVLMTIRLECEDQLFEDIADAFVYTEWVLAADGSWTADHSHEKLSAAWDGFVNTIKHEVRFFFQQAATTTPENTWEHNPQNILRTIGDLSILMGLIQPIQANYPVYRVRLQSDAVDIELIAEQMGAPPEEQARAGRMNPAGISYLYLAFEQETALSEVLSVPPCAAVIARFETQRILNILDLTNLPSEPSIFDEDKHEEREALLFLVRFVEEISQPVLKDGREHISYVPSQVVCEYFAQIFKVPGGKNLDGILYPSAVRPGGGNLVLFPTERGFKRQFDQVAFQGAWEQSFANWAELSAALNV